MDKQIIIKELQIGGLDDIIRIASDIPEFEIDITQKFVIERLKGKDNLITVAYSDNKPVGFVLWYDRDGGGSFYCWLAAVRPESRRLGVFKSLMLYGEKKAKENGYTRLRVKTKNKFKSMLFYLVKSNFNIVSVVQKDKIELEKEI